MTANNWTACPKCAVVNRVKKDAAIEKARAMYGKASPEEYKAALELAESMPGDAADDSMREDYELGFDSNGMFYVSFRSSCSTCDFSYSYEHSESAVKRRAAKR